MARKKTRGLAAIAAHKAANTHADAVDPDAAPDGWVHDSAGTARKSHRWHVAYWTRFVAYCQHSSILRDSAYHDTAKQIYVNHIAKMLRDES